MKDFSSRGEQSSSNGPRPTMPCPRRSRQSTASLFSQSFSHGDLPVGCCFHRVFSFWCMSKAAYHKRRVVFRLCVAMGVRGGGCCVGFVLERGSGRCVPHVILESPTPPPASSYPVALSLSRSPPTSALKILCLLTVVGGPALHCAPFIGSPPPHTHTCTTTRRQFFPNAGDPSPPSAPPARSASCSFFRVCGCVCVRCMGRGSAVVPTRPPAHWLGGGPGHHQRGGPCGGHPLRP